MDERYQVTVVFGVDADAFKRASDNASHATDGNVDLSDLIEESLRGIFGESVNVHMITQD